MRTEEVDVGDGRLACVIPLTFGRGRICMRRSTTGKDFIDDSW